MIPQNYTFCATQQHIPKRSYVLCFLVKLEAGEENKRETIGENFFAGEISPLSSLSPSIIYNLSRGVVQQNFHLQSRHKSEMQFQ